MISQQAESVRAVVGITSNRLLADGVHRDWLRRKYVQALGRYAGVTSVILPTIDADDAGDDSVLPIMPIGNVLITAVALCAIFVQYRRSR